jgi:hypothetical protein
MYHRLFCNILIFGHTPWLTEAQGFCDDEAVTAAAENENEIERAFEAVRRDLQSSSRIEFFWIRESSYGAFCAQTEIEEALRFL